MNLKRTHGNIAEHIDWRIPDHGYPYGSNDKGPPGSTALMMAARFGHLSVVRLLIKHGANKDIAARTSLGGESRLQTALQFARNGDGSIEWVSSGYTRRNEEVAMYLSGQEVGIGYDLNMKTGARGKGASPYVSMANDR